MTTVTVLAAVVTLTAAAGVVAWFALRGGDLARRDDPAVTNQETHENGDDGPDPAAFAWHLNDPSRWW